MSDIVPVLFLFGAASRASPTAFAFRLGLARRPAGRPRRGARRGVRRRRPNSASGFAALGAGFAADIEAEAPEDSAR